VNILLHTLRVLDEPVVDSGRASINYTERDDDDSQDVARCDVCDENPGERTIFFAGIETWVCDECADPAPRWARRSVANAWQDRDADDAGVPMYGEI